MADDSIADPPVEVRMRAFDKGEIKPGDKASTKTP